ncbi:MAG TPA: PBP1A family penicillin-binding protein [Deltaproteobacteria bacterium]|nr:PBP1A family penicillin-binding protein [Deltaproteobacteria bacterium]
MAFFRSGGIRIALVILAVMAAAAAVGAMAIYVLLIRDLPDFRSLDDYRPPVVSEVFDRNGRLIGEFYTQKRRLVRMDEIPRHVQYAFVAAEDGSFFEHGGVDYVSIVRAAIANLREGGISQGASTITQQMVKSLLLSPERTYKRKMREIILARRIEQKFSKEEILYLYLNQIYFGNAAWGIGQAARSYFGKEAPDLTISEAALLAGLPQRPSAYDPTRNPKAAEARRRYVLGRMLADHYIDQATYEAELASPPEIKTHADRENFEAAGYFTEEVRRLLFERLDSEVVLNEGLQIHTTLDIDLQRTARDAIQRGLIAHDHRRGYRGPLRHVSPEEIPAELEKLEEVNAGKIVTTVLPPEGALALEGKAGEDGKAGAGSAARRLDGMPETEAASVMAAEGGSRAGTAPIDGSAGPAEPGDDASAEPIIVSRELPLGEPVTGVVVEVDRRTQTARVGFGKDLFGVARLEDVDWARKPDPKIRPRPVKKITSIFKTGDVARFIRLPDDPEAAAGPDVGEQAAPLARLDIWQEPLAEGALLSIENDTGDVIAMIGGYDFARSEFNRAVQALRQPGSAFKPFIYGAALTRGYTPVTKVIDRPVVYTDPASGFVWAPRNYGQKFYGPMTMRDALKKSVNNATVHLFRDLGVRYVIDYARRFGIQSPLSSDLSLALGSSALTLLELTRAYAVYPRGGTRVIPRFITSVVDRDGNEILGEMPLGKVPPPVLKPLLAEGETRDESYPDAEIMPTAQIISPADAYLMSDLLRAVVQEGTGRRLKKLGRTLAGKTGTTNDFSDAWFMGFSPELTTGVWVGNDDNKTLGWGETGARAALPIWGDFMKVALAPYPRRDFEVPDHIEFQRIDRASGLLAEANTQNAYFQPFLEGTAPEHSVKEESTSKRTRQAARDDIF